MIKNRNMHADARIRRAIGPAAAIATATALQRNVLVFDPDHDIQIHRIDFSYNVASDPNTPTAVTMDIGIDGTLQKYCAFAPLVSKAVGTNAQATILSSAVLAKNTALVFTKTAGSGITNVGFVQPIVCYSVIDKASS